MNIKSRMEEQHRIGKASDSPIQPMGAVLRFFTRLLLTILIVGALTIAQFIVNLLGVSD